MGNGHDYCTYARAILFSKSRGESESENAISQAVNQPNRYCRAKIVTAEPVCLSGA